MKHRLSTSPHGGFTVIELAVVLAIIGILLAAVLTPLALRVQTQQFQDQQRRLQEIKDALIGYAQTQGRLPCPDTDNPVDGVENVGCTGTSATGTLPFGTLGLGPTDRWGRRYVYAVSVNMTQGVLTGQPPSTTTTDLTDTGVLTVNEKQTDKTLIPITTSAAAVIVSLGANGFGGVDSDGKTLVAPTGADELENSDAATCSGAACSTFITRIRTTGGAACDDTVAASNFCEFDDLVALIPTPLLLGKLVQAGLLP